MFKHILVPTDGSPLATIALDNAIALARETDARITALSVVEPFHTFSLNPDQLGETQKSYEAHAVHWADDILANAAGKALAAGVRCETVRVVAEEPYRAIIETAMDRGADLIAMASHGRRGLDAVLLGSQTQKVLTHSGIPVLVYR
ncbi:universal stress protein [Kaistia geumhonensis]|uniref:Nucleotide-binding universal stress UspA family protein n=1 Tax=Kaistia geumhonensis TaxID=410839 RepID=A0ABU0M2H8_9HYPH|nr:universal stress protein [Kaistia geumhonensis]MCX5479618.1 universal stress protein [Kaistia geumhonensis]MDQ0515159.1 nucleotide-binding universal stress UspA family protein [Kaistia geumhonensis]